MRGEYVAYLLKHRPNPGSPPHARGIHIFKTGYYDGIGITPACAGNTMTLFPLSCELRDHPRMRGEYGIMLFNSEKVQGSPPHARGIHTHVALMAEAGGITPACAGNTAIPASGAKHQGDHPRMRGEYISFCLHFFTFLWITPACAGNTDPSSK